MAPGDGTRLVSAPEITVTDSTNLTEVQNLEGTERGVNEAPIGISGETTTAEDLQVTIAVLANDTDPDGDPFPLPAQPRRPTVP